MDAHATQRLDAGINTATFNPLEYLREVAPEELSPAERLLVQGDLKDFLATLSRKQKVRLHYKWDFWARPDQRLPTDDAWDVFAAISGRGSGKTRTGSEIVHQWAANPKWHFALVGETAAECRDVMVEGKSGLLKTAPPWNPCIYEPSKRRVVWPRTGAWGTLYSGDSPDQLRGPNTHGVWCDELAKYRYPDDVWDNIEMLNRMGEHPRVIVTTTPRPIKLIRTLLADAWTVVRRVATFRNALNLAKTFLRRLIERYVGTRKGRQELYAEVLDDAPGALWERGWIDDGRVVHAPTLDYIAVGVDPPGGDVTECGIVASGIASNYQDSYVLADDSIAGKPEVWAKQVWTTAIAVRANVINAERNHGGLMVQYTLETARPAGCTIPVELVTASQGKQVRAEPAAMLAEQRRLHHVGTFADLEGELCSWEPHSGMKSPNRLDALVWSLVGIGATETEDKFIEVYT